MVEMCNLSNLSALFISWLSIPCILAVTCPDNLHQSRFTINMLNIARPLALNWPRHKCSGKCCTWPCWCNRSVYISVSILLGQRRRRWSNNPPTLAHPFSSAFVGRHSTGPPLTLWDPRRKCLKAAAHYPFLSELNKEITWQVHRQSPYVHRIWRL